MFSNYTCLTTKLTLTIEQKVIKSAKLYAEANGRSLSDLVESYLKTLSEKEKTSTEFSPRVKRLIGAIKLPEDFDYKQSLKNGIDQKYGK